MDVIIHKPVKALLAEALEALPERLDLVYVDYRDQLTEEQVANLLEGDMEALGESMWDWESDNRYEAIKYQLGEILDSEDAERLMDDDEAWTAFREACEGRDESDPLRDLMRSTPAIMVRYRVGDHDVTPGSWSMPEEEIEEEMHGIAEAAGIDFDTNRKALFSLVTEASYGGTLCVLHRSSLEDVLSVANGGTVVFTDPILLVYDGLNGSGHMENIEGAVTVEIGEDTMRHDVGSYSWSDGIAGIVHSCAETPAEFKPKEEVEA